MYLSRLTFHTQPGKTLEVEERLGKLRGWVAQAGGANPRVMRMHYGSSNCPDLVFEQEVSDPGTLEQQITQVTHHGEFQEWARQLSSLLMQPAKRELYSVRDGA